jgi:hypothetical protein
MRQRRPSLALNLISEKDGKMDSFARELGQSVCGFLDSINAHVLVIQTCGAFGENTIIVGYVVIIVSAIVVLSGISQVATHTSSRAMFNLPSFAATITHRSFRQKLFTRQ